MLNNKVTRWWMNLESPTQYMYWIIAFCAMLAAGIALIVGIVSMGLAETLIMPILLGIGAFVLFFMFVVLWLTIYWPTVNKNN